QGRQDGVATGDHLCISPHNPIEMAEGAMQATMNVDFSASAAPAPCAIAVLKCPWSSVVACAVRGSEEVSAIRGATKSAMAASGSALDHSLTPGTCLARGTSMTWAAIAAQMFSVAAR